MTLNGGPVLYSHSQVDVQTDFTNGTTTPTGLVYPTTSFTATKSYLGIAGKGYATIKYANPSDPTLRRPLIVAEGYDPGNITKPEEKFGITNLTTFLDDIDRSQSSNLIPLLHGSPSQYDIIYVDWKNGTDYMQRNAYLLETIIQWVNANKQPLGGVMQPNVVLGQSMGGVIARYALKDMENNSINHNTRLYISDDAPHQGANVPEGYQHLARHARGLYIRAGVSTIWVEIVQLIRGRESPLAALSLADQPASKQMLINFVNENNTFDNSVHNTWETELKNMGYPNGSPGTVFRKVAVSNGSECANPQAFGPGANLLTYSGKATTRILGDLAATAILQYAPIIPILLGQPLLLLGVIPGRNDFNFDFYVNAQADGYSNQVYHGKITYTKTILWLIPVTVTLTNRNYTSNAATLPYDYFPGGYYSLASAGFDLNNSSAQNIFYKYNIIANNQPTLNFVPTVSALDIGSNNVALTKSDYLTRYVGAMPPAAPKNTPFQNFITAFNNSRVNEQHISFESRNGDWIAAELNSQMPSANCSSSCDLSTINGDASVCHTSNPYSIPNLPTGSTVYWSATPNLVTFSCNPCSTPTATSTGNGTITITSTIQNSCGSIVLTKPSIVVGAPTITNIAYSMNGGCNGTYQTWSLAASANTAVSTWLWTVDNPNSGSWYIYHPNSASTFVDVSGGGGISVTATNACGSSKQGVTIYSNCGHSNAIIASPNPTSSDLTVSLTQPLSTSTASTNSKTQTPKMIYQVLVADQAGNVRKQFNYSAGVNSTKINLTGLLSGTYTIVVFDGTDWNGVQVIKE